MSQVLYLDSSSSDAQVAENSNLFRLSLSNSSVESFRKLNELIKYISVKGNSELDLDYPTIVIINDSIPSVDENDLDKLSFDDMELLLLHHYKHLNILVYKLSEFSFTHINNKILEFHSILKNRILRMKSWVGLNNSNTKKCPCLHSMTNCLNIILQNDYHQSDKLARFVQLINSKISFYDLLQLPKPARFYKYCIGNWGFIAHELTCDELTYCALLIFKHAFGVLDPSNPLILQDNDTLSFLLSLRDSYRGGNSFHNFRHAVDVLQATFYFLVRIKTIPTFPEYTTEVKTHPTQQFQDQHTYPDIQPFDYENSLLHPIQSLALLVSAIGHDVGHPGLNNPFLISNKSPIAKLYSNHSVLENYHSTIFQDILSNHWPTFLENDHTQDPQGSQNTKVMQFESIIATDMANHFEYILKVEEISNIITSSTSKRLEIKNNLKHTNIILSLIIKCADISNVARPLLISAKWGIVLAREFSEIAQLAEHLQKGIGIDDLEDPRKPAYFPETINDALKDNPDLHKGQLFFIGHFADSLFKEVSSVLPELRFSTEIVLENKQFWENVKAQELHNQ